MLINKKIVIIMPAYNVESTLEKTIASVPKGCVNEIILVNDCSNDRTVQIAEKLNLTVISHNKNKGYGGAQKTGYREAIRCGFDAVVLLHSDNQYDPALVPQFVSKIIDEKFDVVTGTRMLLGDVLSNGMPLWKYVPNRFLTWLENLVFRTNLTDYHNGYRAYSVAFLKQIPLEYLSEKFDFDTDIIIQAAIRKVRIAEISHSTRYNQENSQMSFGKGVWYGLSILLTISKYLIHKIGLKHQSVFQEVE
jgi:glycosyltransferase involved in cell wall biosynthesis|tara:strand:+ start:3240 stop:3986 length:747 start_codon:yes stop_codon:yes gene_type:complete